MNVSERVLYVYVLSSSLLLHHATPSLCRHLFFLHISPQLPEASALSSTFSMALLVDGGMNRANMWTRSRSGHTGGPGARNEGSAFAMTNLTSDQMLQSHNHVCATEFFNLSVTPLNASDPIIEPN